ncbi:MAG: serine/threonine protein kinase [Acidobacteriota bacterium]|nr:MAG: serine/threonine protein kinase [Acidobacteriota bacterium]
MPKFDAGSDAVNDIEAANELPASSHQEVLDLSELDIDLDEDIVFELRDDSSADTHPAIKGPQDDEIDEPARGENVRFIRAEDIPPGHADIENSGRTRGLGASFDEKAPESFVGRSVKGRFLATEYLGDSGVGHLYVGQDDLHDERPVVIQIFHDEDDEIMSSILAEERISLLHFSHPNIARMIDSGEFVDQRRYVVVEHHDHLSVSDIMAIHGRLSSDRTASIIKQVAYGLSNAHQEGLLHRDIEPSNIAIERRDDGSERAILIGMGLSKGDPDEYTAFYRAPEVLEGRIPTVASDIFALGATAFEMLTGQLPFSGNTPKELISAQRNSRPAIPADVAKNISPLVESVLMRAMSPNPATRFAKAREYGDALHHALVDCAPEVPKVRRDSLADVIPTPASSETVAEHGERKEVILKPLAKAVPAESDPAWTRRSPEPPSEGSHLVKIIAAVGIPVLLILLGVGWYFLVKTPVDPSLNSLTGEPGSAGFDTTVPNVNSDIEVPPLPRTIPQPPNTSFYQNTKQNLKGDLLLNFVGFTVYYPKDWKVNGPQVRENVNSRGKFLDISRETPEGMMKEQMLISYYPSRGTFKEDVDKFPQLAKEANETLKKLLPGYQQISEGETQVNGNWRAYELKFQAGGRSPSGENITVWGRRLFIPAARPGVRAGFEITMLATSFSDEVRGADDVGTKGELAKILYTFEPSQNF